MNFDALPTSHVTVGNGGNGSRGDGTNHATVPRLSLSVHQAKLSQVGLLLIVDLCSKAHSYGAK